MTPIKRPVAAVGAAALLALSLSACGGAPTDASKEDYCKAVKSQTSGDDFEKAVTDKDYDKVADLLKDRVKDIEDVGTPDDISDDAREGFEIQVKAAKDVSGDDIKKAFEDNSSDPFEADLSKDEKDKVKAYNEYESKTCSDTDSGSGSSSDDRLVRLRIRQARTRPSLPTEPPTDLPTEMPSGMPTDIPTDPSELASMLESLTASPSLSLPADVRTPPLTSVSGGASLSGASDDGGRLVAVGDHGPARPLPAHHPVDEVDHVVALLSEVGRRPRRASARLAHDECLGRLQAPRTHRAGPGGSISGMCTAPWIRPAAHSSSSRTSRTTRPWGSGSGTFSISMEGIMRPL
nr:hypothetical protein [Nocardioides convexus]